MNRWQREGMGGGGLEGDVVFRGSVRGRRVTLEVTYPREPRGDGLPAVEGGTAVMVFDSPNPPPQPPPPVMPEVNVEIFYPTVM